MTPIVDNRYLYAYIGYVYHRDIAVQAIEGARRVVKEAIASAVAADAFADVGVLARTAESLAALLLELQEGPGSSIRQEESLGGQEQSLGGFSAPLPPVQEAATPQRVAYPYYLRDGDRLVKRAWSRKDRQPYEHKAPREIVGVLLGAIRTKRGEQRPFDAADVMPLYRQNGEEYPSYQSYLALGWLRAAGAIAKGRDGYLLKQGWDGERVSQLWETLPSMA